LWPSRRSSGGAATAYWWCANFKFPKYKSAGAPTTEEIAANVRDYVAANFGTWSVNEADKTLTKHFDDALTPNTAGTEQKTIVSLSGDELRLSTVSPAAAGHMNDVVYRRAR